MQEKEQQIHEMDIQIGHKDMELRAIKIDNETVCFLILSERLFSHSMLISDDMLLCNIRYSHTL